MKYPDAKRMMLLTMAMAMIAEQRPRNPFPSYRKEAMGPPCKVCGKECKPKKFDCSAEHYKEWMNKK